MNLCIFVGKIIEDPILEKENNIHVVRFLVSVEEVKKDRHGEKVKAYNTLAFEAWDSGADAIYNACPKGTMIIIESSAKFDQETEEVYFRVNNFKVAR